MILHAIEATHVGRFRERVRLGPFAAGLNILAAPNEAGKSTVIRAAARALFDRHTTRGDELKALQPAGSDLPPRIAVEFETRAGRFRIEKTFLLGPRSQLGRWQSGAWQPVAEADAADQRVQELLQSSLPGRGATRPEHWGFLGFLWARQGEPAEWPGLDDPAVGQRIRARLARVELDPVIERLRARLADDAGEILTATGQAKTNGPLRQAEDELAAIEAGLAAVRQTRADIEAAQQHFLQLDAQVAQMEREHADREAAAAAVRELTLTTERLRGELGAREQALAVTLERLTAVNADAGALARHQSETAAVQTALASAETTAVAEEQRLAEIRAELDLRQSGRPQHEVRLQSLRAELQRVQALIRLRQSDAEAAGLARQWVKAETAAAELAAIESKLAALPALTPAGLRRIEELTESVRNGRAQVQALGLTVELTPESDGSVTVVDGTAAAGLALPAGQTRRLSSPSSLQLQLRGWGRVVIRSGAQEAEDAAERLAGLETALRTALAETGVASVELAREALVARREVGLELKNAQTALGSLLGDHSTLAALRDASAAAARRSAALVSGLNPTGSEKALGQTDLETDEARLAAAIPAVEQGFKALDRRLDELRADERKAVRTHQDAQRLAGEHRTRLRTLESQVAALAARHPEGMEPARTAAQLAFAQAEARVVATRAELPPDHEKLPERNRRATAALQQLANDVQARRGERDQTRGRLETLGGQGLYSRETELEERQAEAILRRDAALARGWSARLVHDLIEHRKQAATQAVLTPLENRLTAAMGELTGDTSRRVFLDERLQIAGLGPTREETYPFESLSQGAKEQLLLCLRIAVAQELATEEPQVLILDDVLVNTDAVRQERILDLLGSLAGPLQVLILTCHPDRYRGVGVSLSFA
jgi:hypothetical protein